MTRSNRMTWAGSCVLSGALGAAITLMLGAGQNAQQPNTPVANPKKIPVSITYAPGAFPESPGNGFLICVCTDGTFAKAMCNNGVIGTWSVEK